MWSPEELASQQMDFGISGRDPWAQAISVPVDAKRAMWSRLKISHFHANQGMYAFVISLYIAFFCTNAM